MAGRFGATVAVAVTLLVLGGPAAVPSWAAGTDPATGSAQPGPESWQPPPVQPSLAPPDSPPGPPPGTSYQAANACVASAAAGAPPLTAVPPAQDMLDIKGAQEFSTGKGVTVAVIDTGVNPHPFLRDRLLGGGDYVDPATGNGTTDCDGHGTLTAGIIAANTSSQPDLGFTGVAPDARILAIRQTSQVYKDQQGGSTAGTPGTLASAIVRAASTPGVGVITTSVDECEPETEAKTRLGDPQFGDPELQAAVSFAYNRNIVVVNSAGNIPSAPDPSQGGQSASTSPCQNVPQNDNSNPNDVKQVEVPALYSDVLSVASVDPRTGGVSNFSEWGPWVSVAAPGEDITSVDPGQNATGLANEFAEPGSNQTPEPIQGTSFAAPYVAGLAALIRSRFPDLTARQVMDRIESTAQHPSGPGGRNNQVGFGIINPVAALTAVIPGQNGVPMATDSRIPAVLPHDNIKNWQPFDIAMIGIGTALVLLLITGFTTRTIRHNRTRNPR